MSPIAPSLSLCPPPSSLLCAQVWFLSSSFLLPGRYWREMGRRRSKGLVSELLGFCADCKCPSTKGHSPLWQLLSLIPCSHPWSCPLKLRDGNSFYPWKPEGGSHHPLLLFLSLSTISAPLNEPSAPNGTLNDTHLSLHSTITHSLYATTMPGVY